MIIRFVSVNSFQKEDCKLHLSVSTIYLFLNLNFYGWNVTVISQSMIADRKNGIQIIIDPKAPSWILLVNVNYYPGWTGRALLCKYSPLLSQMCKFNKERIWTEIPVLRNDIIVSLSRVFVLRNSFVLPSVVMHMPATTHGSCDDDDNNNKVIN